MRRLSRGLALMLSLLLLAQEASVHSACADPAPMGAMHHGAGAGHHQAPASPSRHQPCPPPACATMTSCVVAAAPSPSGSIATIPLSATGAWVIPTALPPTPAAPPESPPPRA